MRCAFTAASSLHSGCDYLRIFPLLMHCYSTIARNISAFLEEILDTLFKPDIWTRWFSLLRDVVVFCGARLRRELRWDREYLELFSMQWNPLETATFKRETCPRLCDLKVFTPSFFPYSFSSLEMSLC